MKRAGKEGSEGKIRGDGVEGRRERQEGRERKKKGREREK